MGGARLLEILACGNSCAPTECDQIDFKRQVNDDDVALAESCRDIAAFYNTYGGYIIVGIAEHDNETFEVVGAASGFDVERVKNKLRDFTGERILITQEKCSWSLPTSSEIEVFVLNVPARHAGDPPVAFLKDGPAKGSKGRRIFEKGEIPIREGDETTIARGAKVVEIWESRPHPLLSKLDTRNTVPLSRVQHNLPDRSIICPQVMGRDDALEHLWRWLPDDLSHVKVLAGEGGIGKSSIAYEFADQVSLLSHQAFEQVIWLSAKQRQFRPLTNSYDEMVETHFGTYDELLDRICDFLAVTEDERTDSNRPKKLRLIKQGFAIMPCLIIVDDIDSLEDTEQRQALELGFILSGTQTKLLLTTRNNKIYSGDVCYTVRGIEKTEFPDFFEALMARFPSPTRRVLKPSEIDRIWEASGGSPLFAESILRLLAYQSVGEAIGHWKGEAGDDVRRAALHREITQLSPEARRILLTLALLSEASLAELAEVTGYDPSRISNGIQNLSSLFLVEAPKLGGENRIRVSETTGRLVLSIRRELASDHVRLEKAITHFRATASEGHQRAGNKLVGSAILQASALERQGKISEALETLKHAARKTGKGKRGDLLAYIGYLYTKQSTPEFELARRACRESFNDGCSKPKLFETWFNAEWELGNFPGTEEVARAALDKKVEPTYEWRIRLAAALSSKAHAQGSGRISVSTLPAYLEASRELAEAINLAPADEARKWRGSLEDANDSIYRASLDAVESPLDRLSVIRHLSSFIRFGDLRIRNYVRLLQLVEELLTIAWKNENSRSTLLTATQSAFEDIRNLINHRIEKFPNDERHEALQVRADLFSTKFNHRNLPERIPNSDGLVSQRQEVEVSKVEREEHHVEGNVISSTNAEFSRPSLPDRLSTDKRSPYYASEYFNFKIGIRINGKERFDVQEYCVSEGWIRVPVGKSRDRKGNNLLIKIAGAIEAFYKDS